MKVFFRLFVMKIHFYFFILKSWYLNSEPQLLHFPSMVFPHWLQSSMEISTSMDKHFLHLTSNKSSKVIKFPDILNHLILKEPVFFTSPIGRNTIEPPLFLLRSSKFSFVISMMIGIIILTPWKCKRFYWDIFNR